MTTSIDEGQELSPSTKMLHVKNLTAAWCSRSQAEVQNLSPEIKLNWFQPWQAAVTGASQDAPKLCSRILAPTGREGGDGCTSLKNASQLMPLQGYIWNLDELAALITVSTLKCFAPLMCHKMPQTHAHNISVPSRV